MQYSLIFVKLFRRCSLWRQPCAAFVHIWICILLRNKQFYCLGGQKLLYVSLKLPVVDVVKMICALMSQRLFKLFFNEEQCRISIVLNMWLLTLKVLSVGCLAKWPLPPRMSWWTSDKRRLRALRNRWLFKQAA